jgi:hypothetical protein
VAHLDAQLARGWLSPHRRPWGNWEDALLHFGFTPEAIAERLEPGRERSNDSLARFQYE